MKSVSRKQTIKLGYGQPNNESEVIHEHEVVEEKPMSLMEVEKEMIQKSLTKFKGKRKDAAKELGISERTLYRKINEYGIQE